MPFAQSLLETGPRAAHLTDLLRNKARALRFVDLHIDVLICIMRCLLRPPVAPTLQSVSRLEDAFDGTMNAVLTYPVHSLQALAVTCRYLRAVCVPLIFQHIIVGELKLDYLPPASLLPHVQFVGSLVKLDGVSLTTAADSCTSSIPIFARSISQHTATCCAICQS